MYLTSTIMLFMHIGFRYEPIMLRSLWIHNVLWSFCAPIHIDEFTIYVVSPYFSCCSIFLFYIFCSFFQRPSFSPYFFIIFFFKFMFAFLGYTDLMCFSFNIIIPPHCFMFLDECDAINDMQLYKSWAKNVTNAKPIGKQIKN